MLLHPVNESNNSNSSSDDLLEEELFIYQQFRIIKLTSTQLFGLNEQTSELSQQSEAAVNIQLGAKHNFLQIIPVKLSNGYTFIETNALLGCGSDPTLLWKDFAQRLNLKGKHEKLSVTSALSKSQNIDQLLCHSI